MSRSSSLLFLLIVLLLGGVWLLRLQQMPAILHLENTRPLISGLLHGDLPPGQYPSPRMGGTAIRFGGPLLDLLHLPAGLFGNPILGMHITYALYELLVICMWLVLGLRAGISPAQVWTSAVIMAASGVLLDGLAENSVLCGYMHVPFFMVIVLALSKSRAWAYVLAGSIFGLCAAVHLAITMLISPASLLCVALTRQKMPRLFRLLWFGAGFLLVLLCVLPFSDFSWPIIPTFSLSEASKIYDPMSVVRWLGFLLLHPPVWIVGLGLVAARRLWGIQLAPHELLAALWMLIGAPLLAVGVSYLGVFPHAYRLVVLLPGIVLLDAMVLTRLAEWIKSRCSLGPILKARHGHVLIVLTLVLLAVIGKKNLDAKQVTDWVQRDNSNRISAYHYKYFENIKRLPWVMGEDPVAVLGHDVSWTLNLLKFTRGGRERFTDKPVNLPSRCVAFLEVFTMPDAMLSRASRPVGQGRLPLAGTCLAYLDRHVDLLPYKMEVEVPPGNQAEVSVLVAEESFGWKGYHPRIQPEARQNGKALEVLHGQKYGVGRLTIYRLPLSTDGDRKFVVHLPPRPEGWRATVMVLDEAVPGPTSGVSGP